MSKNIHLLNNKINKFIPKFIKESQNYQNNFYKKTLSSKLIINFEEKASKDLNKFINSSQSRYKLTKIGNDYFKILKNNYKHLSPFINKIQNIYFYTNADTINDEIEKLKFKINTKKLKQLNTNLKTKLYKEKKNFYTNNTVLSLPNLKSNSQIKKINNFNTKKNSKLNLLKNNEILLENEFNKDQNKLNSEFDKYKNKIYDYNNLLDEEEIKNYRKKIECNTSRLTMLNFKKIVETNKPKNNKENNNKKNNINFNAIINYLYNSNKIKKSKSTNNSLLISSLKDTRSTVNEQSKKYLEIKNNNNIKIKQIEKLLYDEKNTLPTLNYYSERIKNLYKKKYQKERKEYLKKSQSLSNSDIKRLEYNLNLRKYLKRWKIDDAIENLYI